MGPRDFSLALINLNRGERRARLPTKGGRHEAERAQPISGNGDSYPEGQAMAEVAVKVGNLEFIAAITEGSVKNMGLKVHDSVTVAVKATEVMIGK